MENNFYIYLPSNIDTNEFPQNVTSHFVTPLPKSLDLSDEWSVGLYEITYPKSWYNIPFHPSNQRTIVLYANNYIFHSNPPESFADVEKLPMVVKTGQIPFGNYKNVDELIEEINTIIKPNVEFKIDQTNLRPTLNIPFGTSLIMSKWLSKLLRLPIQNEGDDTIPRDLQRCTGGEPTTLLDFKKMAAKEPPTRTITAVSTPTLDIFTKNLFIYTNIVRHTIVGNNFIQLLRVVHVNGDYGQNINVNYINPQYIKLNTDSIKHVEIRMCDDQGELIKFEYGRVIVVLHFKKDR